MSFFLVRYIFLKLQPEDAMGEKYLICPRIAKMHLAF